jgi:hypothetical protein
LVKLVTLAPVGWSASAGKPSSPEEGLDRLRVAAHLGLRLGKVGGGRRIGDRPGREVGGDVALGKPAHGDSAVGVLGAQQPVAKQVAARDQPDRENPRRPEPAQRGRLAQDAAGRMGRLKVVAAHRMFPPMSWCDELCINIDEWSLNGIPAHAADGHIAAGGRSALRPLAKPMQIPDLRTLLWSSISTP